MERPDVTGIALLDDDSGSHVWTGPPTASRQTLIARARSEGLAAASVAPVQGDDVLVEQSIRLTIPDTSRPARRLVAPVVSPRRDGADGRVDGAMIGELFSGTQAALTRSADGSVALAERQIEQLQALLDDERQRARVQYENLRIESQAEIGRLRGELEVTKERAEERRIELAERLSDKRAQLEADARRQRAEDQAAARDELQGAVDRARREVEEAKRASMDELDRLKRQLREARDETEAERDKRRRQAREFEDAASLARGEALKARQVLEEELEMAKALVSRSRGRMKADEETLFRLLSDLRESDDPDARDMVQQIIAKRVGVEKPNPQNAQLAQLAQMFMDIAARRFAEGGATDRLPVPSGASPPPIHHANSTARATHSDEELHDL